MELAFSKGSSKVIFLFFIFIISIGLSDLSISDQEQNQYEPLYVIKKKNAYEFVPADTYDRVMNQGKYNESGEGEIMLAACSKTNTDDKLLEISSENEQQLAGGFRCNSPVKFFSKYRSGDINCLIGFMIYDENGTLTGKNNFSFADLPKEEFPVSLIKVAYKQTKYNHSITTFHYIKYSNKLSSIYEEPDDQTEYASDMHIYGFDIDPAYEKENQLKFIKTFFAWEFVPESSPELVKLQLAPAGDFFFDAWKRASKTNINTTPVWKELASEWHQFEEFIRRVSNFVGDLQIITGGSDPHHHPHPKETFFLHLYTNENQLSVPLFDVIYKAVYFSQKRKNGTWIHQGMIFLMLNDPRDTYNIGEDLTAKYGWKYLKDEKLKPRIVGQLMTPSMMKKAQTTINVSYEPLDLNKVKKIIKIGEDQEEEIEIDVLQKMGLKNEN